jgi:hypothetical protein
MGGMMHDISINYLGDESILTHPLYLKWSQNTLTAVKAGLVPLKADLSAVEANMHNLKIIAYLSTLIRIAGMI